MPETLDPEPWYRRRTYRGKMSEANKVELDAIRQKEPHPAVSFDQLPKEVQRYINRVEFNLYDANQALAASRFAAWIGLAFVVAYFADEEQIAGLWGAYALAMGLVCVGWLSYRKNTKKNWLHFMEFEDGRPNCSDLGIQEEWELNYISQIRR